MSAFGFKGGFKPATRLAITPEVYLGIDFGTTFTKVSYRLGTVGAKVHSVSFLKPGDRFRGEENHCMPSKVWLDPNDGGSLVFDAAPDPRLQEVRYFKYGMIERRILEEQSVDFPTEKLKNDVMRLCSAFYLANLIYEVKEKISAQNPNVFNTYNEDEIRWYVNMGVPVSDCDSEQKSVYDEVLNVAWEIAGDDVSACMGLQFLDGLYERFKDCRSHRLKTVPELFAESLMIWQGTRFGTGFYTVIDIGGGTADIAVFYKKIDMFSDEVRIMCIAQDVKPIGYEMLLQKGREASKDEFCRSYAGSFTDAHDKFQSEMRACAQNHQKHSCFFMGGARQVAFYHECVQDVCSAHNEVFFLQTEEVKEDDMIDLMDDRSNVEIPDNPRLFISQMLCQPYELIPPLDGLPWHFTQNSWAGSSTSPEEVQEQIYGD